MNTNDIDLFIQSLVEVGIPLEIAQSLTSANVKINGLSLQDMVSTSMLLDNSRTDNFIPSILYKAIFYTVDFSREDIKQLITDELEKYDYDMVDAIPNTVRVSLLTLEDGHTALKLCRFIEKDYKRAEPLIQSIIKKSYPKINNYVKKNKAITDSYFTSIEASYGIDLELPEDRNMFYILACLLKGKYISVMTSARNSVKLDKLKDSVVAYDLSRYNPEDDQSRGTDVSKTYQKFDDSTGFYNADLPDDAPCKYKEPFREIVNIKPNTTAGQLRKDIIKHFSIVKDTFKDPYNVVFKRFISRENKLDYSNVDKYAKTYPLTVAYNDIDHLLKLGTRSSLNQSLGGPMTDMTIDLCMRHMARHRLGVKKDSEKVIDYLCFIASTLKSLFFEREYIILNALAASKEENEYINIIAELKSHIEQLQQNLNDVIEENNELLASKDDELLEKKVSKLEAETFAKSNKIQKLETQLCDKDEEIKALYELINSKELEIEEVDNEITTDQMLQQLSDKSIVLIGSNPDFISKVNKHLPTVTTMSMEQSTRKVTTVNKADIALIDVSFTSHSNWWKVKDIYPNKQFIYLKPQTNIELWISQVYTKAKSRGFLR